MGWRFDTLPIIISPRKAPPHMMGNLRQPSWLLLVLELAMSALVWVLPAVVDGESKEAHGNVFAHMGATFAPTPNPNPYPNPYPYPYPSLSPTRHMETYWHPLHPTCSFHFDAI